MHLALQSVDMQNAAGVGFDHRFHHHLPTGIPQGDHVVAQVDTEL
jgi:hypothetical protein